MKQFLTTLFVCAIIGAVAYVVYKPNAIQTILSAVQMSKTATYSNSEYGFSFSYPSHIIVDKKFLSNANTRKLDIYNKSNPTNPLLVMAIQSPQPPASAWSEVNLGFVSAMHSTHSIGGINRSEYTVTLANGQNLSVKTYPESDQDIEAIDMILRSLKIY